MRMYYYILVSLSFLGNNNAFLFRIFRFLPPLPRLEPESQNEYVLSLHFVYESFSRLPLCFEELLVRSEEGLTAVANMSVKNCQ